MPVEMVRRDIQHDRNFRVKGLNGFQLKARYLKDDHSLRLGALGQRNRRRSDVSADQRGETRGRHDFANKRGGSGLAVRSGDGHDRAGQELRRKFDLANHRLAEGPRLHQRRRIHGHAGAYHDQVLASKSAVAMPAGLHRDAVIEQHGNLVAQFVPTLGVRDGDLRSMRLHEQCRRHPGLAEAHDQHAFSVQFH